MTEPTVRDLATANPAAVRVFEKYNIDYCCGGRRPLAEACQELGLDAGTIMAEVEACGRPSTAGPDWTQASLSDLIAYILDTHHAYLNKELPLLEARLEKIAGKHGEKHPSLAQLKQVFAGLKAELECHCRKEEMVLFPSIAEMEKARRQSRAPARLPFISVASPIRVMMHDHDGAGNALREMRRLSGNYAVPEDACPTFRATFADLETLERDLHQHIHLENNILFPRAALLE